jgi:predicted TIM-barrel fold metal-dependent hydrolase
MNFEIWDLHGHLAGAPGKTPEERMHNMIEVADRVGVHRMCIYMGMQMLADPTPEQLRQQNDEVLQALAHWHDRALGFVYLNPKYIDVSMRELERCVAAGPMVGIKLWIAQHGNSPEVDQIVTRATELKAVVFQHTWMKITGNLPGESTPEDVVQLAQRHPAATLVCGHTGGDWELGIRAIAPYGNIFADLGGGDPVAGITEMAVRELGAERVLYGSDIPGRSFASQLAKVIGADIPEQAQRLILGENLKRLLTPILHIQGRQS